MKPSTTVARLANYLSWIVLLILALLPFHAFLTVWSSSALGHYTLLRLWKEFLLLILLFGGIYLLVVDAKVRKKLFASLPARLIGIYSFVTIAWGLLSLAQNTISTKAFFYGTLLNIRFLLFFLLVWLIAQYSEVLINQWKVFVLVPAGVVATLGIIQYWLLPYDFLKHFGYSAQTIFPYETINHDINKIRVASTLRGANPLGAYLLVPLGILTALLIKFKTSRAGNVIFIIVLLCALVFSFSRSAWIGAVISLVLIIWLSLKSKKTKNSLIWVLVGSAVLSICIAIAFHNNTIFENAFLHTDHNSKAIMSSNEGHKAALEQGAHDVWHQPLGKGPGSAGPASVYSNHPARIAENYFVQIAQETGVIGLALFIAINVVVAHELLLRRDSYLAVALFGSLAGLTFINLLSHAWTDDTIAYIWWGLAGLALSTDILGDKSKRHDKEKISSSS